ncbi:hypothetical protein MNV49_002506 [Pseudohyphozyma bogoriensis]|nr:hypothetical protein MNV49_002506 [Pseudohyphozyma bogoriensis]
MSENGDVPAPAAAAAAPTGTPSAFLTNVVGERVVVRLNSGVDYQGVLSCLDGYMNIALEQTEEYVNGVLTNSYGDAFVRGNNVLYISKLSVNEFWQHTVTTAETLEEDFKHQALPLARIKKVMKSDPEVKMISSEVTVLFEKACQIFIQELTARSHLVSLMGKRRTLSRPDVAQAIAKSDMFDFLIDIVPRADSDAAFAGTSGVPPSAEGLAGAEASTSASPDVEGGLEEEVEEEEEEEEREGRSRKRAGGGGGRANGKKRRGDYSTAPSSWVNDKFDGYNTKEAFYFSSNQSL